MRLEIKEESISVFEEYATIPTAFEVDSVFQVEESIDSADKFILTERPVEVPFLKNYDTIAGQHPSQWARRFDISNWRVFTARLKSRLVGGAVAAFSTQSMSMVEARGDLAVLWDLRVSPNARRQGIGSALFGVVEALARAENCRQLVVETQNINVAACRFYEQQGCVLTAVDRYGYPEFPNEVQMIWCKAL
jgi:GNAT superfamily N-acetyltransferase